MDVILNVRGQSKVEEGLTVRRETPTISLFCFQWETSFLNASISNLERIRKGFMFRAEVGEVLTPCAVL